MLLLSYGRQAWSTRIEPATDTPRTGRPARTPPLTRARGVNGAPAGPRKAVERPHAPPAPRPHAPASAEPRHQVPGRRLLQPASVHRPRQQSVHGPRRPLRGHVPAGQRQ